MGVQDRDWYKEAMREREGWFPKRRRIYRRSRQPTPWIVKLAIVLAVLIAAAAAWRYFR